MAQIEKIELNDHLSVRAAAKFVSLVESLSAETKKDLVDVMSNGISSMTVEIDDNKIRLELIID
jgi:hypothetical protein